MIALLAAILALESKLLPYEITGGAALWNFLKRLHSHKNPLAAVTAALKAVAATPDDADTNTPGTPWFVE